MTHSYVPWLIHVCHDSSSDHDGPLLLSAAVYSLHVWNSSVIVCCRVLQCVAVCCSMLRSTYILYVSLKTFVSRYHQQCVTACCSVLQRAEVCCNVLQCAAVCCSALLLHFTYSQLGSHRPQVFWRTARHCNTLQHSATRCNTLQHTYGQNGTYRLRVYCMSHMWIESCCSVLQCVAVFCSVLLFACHIREKSHVAVCCSVLQCVAFGL